jgi:small subunit ribosomal protein S10
MIQKKTKLIRFKIKSYSHKALLLYKTFLIKSLQFSKITFINIDLPLKKKKVTLLKSPHVNKKAKEQFELKTYTSAITVEHNISFVAYAFLNKPKTVFLTVTI